MRVLGAVRVARKEAVESADRQREQITAWTASKGYDIVAWTDDTGVSGQASPFGRPELGRYFREPLADTWDVLAAASLVRLGRSLTDVRDLARWTQDPGKAVRTGTDGLGRTTG